MLTHKIFVGRHVYNCHLAIFWKFNSVPDVSNVLKLPTPILLEVSLSTMGTVFVGFHLRLRQHIIYFHWSSPFQNYLSIFPFLFLKFRIPTIRTLIILFFLPLLSSTLPKSELRAAITTISTSDHSKVTPSKNEEKVQQPRSRLPTRGTRVHGLSFRSGWSMLIKIVVEKIGNWVRKKRPRVGGSEVAANGQFT